MVSISNAHVQFECMLKGEYKMWSNEKLSTFISTGVAIALLLASYLPWYYTSWNGKVRIHLWARVLVGICIAVLCYAEYLLVP
jgi:hypothetical protein